MKTTATIQIGDKPMVLLPLDQYEQMQEDLEMLRATELPQKVSEAREQFRHGQVLSPEELKETLRIA